jgi:uncharacterized coiled-coil protein SlyX
VVAVASEDETESVPGAKADLGQTVRDLEERVDELEGQNQRLHDTVVALDQEVERKQEAIDELVERLRDLEEVGAWARRNHSRASLTRARIKSRLSELEESCLQTGDVEQFKSDVARVKRRQANVEAAVQNSDIDLTDGFLADKITLVRNVGAEAVADRVSSKKKRGELLLENVEDWWSVAPYKGDKWFAIRRSQAQDRLEAARGESLQQNQVWRVFAWIVELTQDSTRDAEVVKKQGDRKLYLDIPDGGAE